MFKFKPAISTSLPQAPPPPPPRADARDCVREYQSRLESTLIRLQSKIWSQYWYSHYRSVKQIGNRKLNNEKVKALQTISLNKAHVSHLFIYLLPRNADFINIQNRSVGEAYRYIY